MSTQFETLNPTRLARCFNVSQAMIMVVRSADLILVDVNTAFEAFTGLSRDLVLGKKPSDVGLWQDDQQRRAIAAQLSGNNGVAQTVVSFHAREGKFGHGNLFAERFEFGDQSYFLASMQRVVLNDEPMLALEASLDSYASFFQDSDEGFFRIWPKQGGIIAANEKFASTLGYASVSELMETSRIMPLNHFLKPEDQLAMVDAVYSDTGKFFTPRVELVRQDQQRVWASISARAVRDRDSRMLFIEGRLTDLSILDAANAKVAHIEEQHRLVVDNASMGVFVTIEDTIKLANPAMCKMLGYESADLIGRRYLDFILPEDYQLMAKRTTARGNGERLEKDYEVRAIRKDSDVRWVSVRAEAIQFDGKAAITGSVRDITDERAAAERLAQAETRYRNLFENASMGLFLVDKNGILLEANRTILKLFGFEDSLQLREYFNDFSHVFADATERLRFTETLEMQLTLQDVEARMMHRNGHEFWVLLSLRVAESGANSIFEGSLQDVSARRIAERQLKFQANHDNLTRLPNRQRFETMLGEFLTRLRLQPFTPELSHWVWLLDLDGFKVVNDSLGHAAGDELLVLIADRLVKELPETLVFSRYGGDEFALTTRDVETEGYAINLAESALRSLSRPFLVRGHQIFATASIGISKMDASYKDPQHVMRDADTAMYRAKSLGKNRYEVFDTDMHLAAQERLQIETDLRFGLDRDEFVTYYQPIVDLRSGRIVGAEALTRWKHPIRGLLLPGVFIKIAEESGLLLSIDLLMMDEACKQMAIWQREFKDQAPQTVSVNVSDRLFAAPGFSGSLADLIRNAGISPSCLQLEVTETVFRGDFNETVAILRELKSTGVRLLVDDFGTGYSSLVSFTDAAFDGLKIDRGFVIDIETNERNRALVKTICQFARDLNLSLVSEGVESFKQTEILIELGCDLGQGFRYAPALSAEAFAARLKSTNFRETDH